MFFISMSTNWLEVREKQIGTAYAVKSGMSLTERCIVLHGIVLYLSIYIAPLAVHTNHRRVRDLQYGSRSTLVDLEPNCSQ